MSYPPYGDQPGPGTPDDGGQAGFNQYGQSPNQGGNYGQPFAGGFGPQSGGGTPPDNNLVWAILSTVLCCLPLGIVSIIKATSVNSLWAQGQHQAAYKAAEDAKKFAMWSAIAAVVVGVLYIVVILGMGGLASMSGY